MSDPTPIENVLAALQSTPTYHPASARLFSDWLVQAGDVVTVSSGGDSYNLPIFNMEMTWKGTPMVEVDCTGKEKRDPPSALQRRSYSAARKQEEDIDGIHSRLEQDENKIGLVVTNTVGGYEVNRASIIASINGGDGHSEVAIEADKVIVAGTSINIGDVVKTSQGLSFVDSGFLRTSGLAQIGTLQIHASGTGTGSSYNIVDPDSVCDVQVVLDGNVYKLQKKTWGNQTWHDTDGTTFSRATTLTGTWSGGTYTVTASPQGNRESTEVIMLPDGNMPSDDFSINVYHDNTLSASNVVLTGRVYLTDDTTNRKVQARWGSATGTTYAEISYSGGGTQRSVDTLTASSGTTYASNVYTVPVTVSYDDSTSGSSSIEIPFGISNYSAGSGGSVGTYTITVAGNSQRTLTPTGAYNAGFTAGQTEGVTKSNIVCSGVSTKDGSEFSDVDTKLSISGTHDYYLITISVGTARRKIQFTQLNNI